MGTTTRKPAAAAEITGTGEDGAVKVPAAALEQGALGVDVAALQAEAAEARAQAAAALEQGQQMLAAAMALVQQGAGAQHVPAGMVTAKSAEPAQDDPRRNLPEEGFEPVIFRAKGVNHRVVRVSQNRFTTLNGEVQALGGIAYDFAENGGDFVARNSNVATFIRSRPGMNLEFWEVGNEPHAAPDPSIVMQKATDAAFDLDADALERLRQQEQASHRRKVVLDHISHCERKIAGS